VTEWSDRLPLALKAPSSDTGDCSKIPSVHAARNRYPALFSTEEVRGGEKEEWWPTSATPLSIHVGCLAATSPHGQ